MLSPENNPTQTIRTSRLGGGSSSIYHNNVYTNDIIDSREFFKRNKLQSI